MKPYYEQDGITLYHGDCREVMGQLPAGSVDTIITDPPYGLEFMGKDWDKAVPGPDFWEAALRVCKPGAMMLAFGGTRLFHRLTCAIEDAGWEIRDCLMWLYGSGFPKSHDISKAIDKMDAKDARRKRDLEFTAWMRSTGITSKQINEITDSDMASHYLTDKEQPSVATLEMFEKMRHLLPEPPDHIYEMMRQRTIESENFKKREVIGKKQGTDTSKQAIACPVGAQGLKESISREFDITAPATPEAALWDGWGTALKPAWEPIVLAMKHLDGTFAENALRHGVAGLNIDGTRIAGPPWKWGTRTDITGGGYGTKRPSDGHVHGRNIESDGKGRWPSNLYLDEDTAPMLDEQSGESISKDGGIAGWQKDGYVGGKYEPIDRTGHNDQGGASRFFYIAKPSKSDRGHREDVELPLFDTVDKGFRNTHPTVKPTPLMERLIILQTYLARLTDTPAIHQGGVILDPFGGSGTTAIAAKEAGRPCIIIERDAENLDITIKRLGLCS